MRRSLVACFALSLLHVACAEPPASEPVARGRQVYRELGCGRCHQIASSGERIGPDLTRIGAVAEARRPGRTAAEYLRESLLDPGAYVVPGFVDSMPRGLTVGLSGDDREALLTYLLALR